MTLWRTTVTDTLRIFRDALCALVEPLARARIEWRDGSSYDDWDEIAQLLFEKIVIASVGWGVPERDRRSLTIPRYDDTLDSYAGMSPITVHVEGMGHLVFHSFGTRDEPFDVVKALRVDEQGRPGDGFVMLPLESVIFQVAISSRSVADLAVDV